jgi:hypothetical protein
MINARTARSNHSKPANESITPERSLPHMVAITAPERCQSSGIAKSMSMLEEWISAPRGVLCRQLFTLVLAIFLPSPL